MRMCMHMCMHMCIWLLRTLLVKFIDGRVTVADPANAVCGCAKQSVAFTDAWKAKVASPTVHAACPACIRHAHAMHMACTRPAHGMHMACTCHAHAMHMPCTLHAHVMHMPCTGQGRPLDSALRAHCTSTAYTPYVH